MSGSSLVDDLLGVATAGLAAGADAVAAMDPALLSTGQRAGLLAALARARDRLGAEIARVAAVSAEADDHRVDGATSPASWVSKQTGLGIGQARGAVELGEAMSAVPELDRAVRSGKLSPGAAATVIPAVDDDGFAHIAGPLIDELAGMTPARAGRHVEKWRAITNPTDDTQRRNTAHDSRSLTFRPLGDGTTHVEGVVPDDTARTLRHALAHLAEQQRLDGTGRTRPQRTADALGDLAAAYHRGEVTGGRNLPRIIITLTLHDLETRRPGRDTLTGQLITSAEIDRLCCDSVIHRYVADQHGATINFGRGKRTATPNQFLALLARDRGCRHPRCDRPPQWCEAHHLREFAARGGLTNIDEMVLLCHHHHHALHNHGWTLSGNPKHLTFTSPTGQNLHSQLPQHDTKRAACPDTRPLGHNPLTPTTRPTAP